LSGLTGSRLALLLAALTVLAVQALADPVITGVACTDGRVAVLYNGTVLSLPTLQRLFDAGNLLSCDVNGYIAVQRYGRVDVYDPSGRLLASVEASGKPLVGQRFLLVAGDTVVRAFALPWGFEAFRLDELSSPKCVRVLSAARAASKAVTVASPCTCPVRMRVESYVLVFDLDTGLWDVTQTGLVTAWAVPSGALWVKNATVYFNGKPVATAGQALPVNGFDGFAVVDREVKVYDTAGRLAAVLPLPRGKGLVVSRVNEGFLACSDYECSSLNASIDLEGIYEPPVVLDGDTYYVLLAGGRLKLVLKPMNTSVTPQHGDSTPPVKPRNDTAQPDKTTRLEPEPQQSTVEQATGYKPGLGNASNALQAPRNATPSPVATPAVATPPQGVGWLLVPLLLCLAAAAFLWLRRRSVYRYVS
jgi:hypothetical protein